ncbi:radical SAM/Cys-rich domain-containing protein [Catalinimonas alkaloidigena]|uniref:Radical SAM/Cys-rich domain-containing protein n=1 Tax=Catalinimonas alkaloidigena TaxID=1075417 RepID=A0A1G9KWQ2_9BACT|nr:arsenosugar biosynthesis radical SAM (seleno)protein ArsS [Catalinimonas alkaloidigena]SDL54132.1 radical SAM/Cys-rich domain-containing protein [Catalinimonas alkaloidigena]
MAKSLLAQQHALADTHHQRQILNRPDPEGAFPSFGERLAAVGHAPLRPARTEIFQVNLGKMCNQTCKHCHVDAGPDRKEIMTRETMQLCLDALAKSDLQTVDLTGGAPEMNPDFHWFVEEIRRLGRRVMVRCNLTIIVANPKYHDLPSFFREHGVEVVSSLPHFSARRTDAQRGEGVFERSIRALRMLNEVGYGKEGSGLRLNLVYNPSGAFLPGDQEELQQEFKQKLKQEWGVEFNQLYAITNMPISRFLEYLLRSGNYDAYMHKLVAAFNPAAVPGVMCRNTLSVGWDGFLYDCDFNQMLDLTTADGSPQHVRDFDAAALETRPIVVGQHCYGCTAGAGSSCGGTTT